MTTSETELVAALRDLARVVHGTETRPVARDEALRLLEQARALLADGEPRRRWYEVDGESDPPAPAGGRELSTFSGTLNPIAPPMVIRHEERDGTPMLIGAVRLDRLREGPPRSVHGGVLAGLFDELLGGGQRLNGGAPGMTGRLTVRYRRPTPLDTDLELRVWIHDERRRRVTVRGRCVVAGTEGSAAVTAEAEAVFLRVDFARLSSMMGELADGETPAAAPARRTDD